MLSNPMGFIINYNKSKPNDVHYFVFYKNINQMIKEN